MRLAVSIEFRLVKRSGLFGAGEVYWSGLRSGLNDNLTLPGNIGWLDYDPVCDCQDFGDLVLESVAITQTDADHADAVVRFRIFKDDKEKTTQTLKMVAENGRWVIDDIVSNHGSVLQAVNSENEKTLAALASLQKEQPEAFVAELFEHIADLR